MGDQDPQIAQASGLERVILDFLQPGGSQAHMPFVIVLAALLLGLMGGLILTGIINIYIIVFIVILCGLIGSMTWYVLACATNEADSHQVRHRAQRPQAARNGQSHRIA